jgi:hypothetical protein
MYVYRPEGLHLAYNNYITHELYDAYTMFYVHQCVMCRISIYMKSQHHITDSVCLRSMSQEVYTVLLFNLIHNSFKYNWHHTIQVGLTEYSVMIAEQHHFSGIIQVLHATEKDCLITHQIYQYVRRMITKNTRQSDTVMVISLGNVHGYH